MQTGQLGTVPNWVERKYMLEEKVLGTIKKYEQIKSGDTIVLGVSGGPDSICLLNILKNLQNELKIDIVVAHINHMIREEADLETDYVRDFCIKKNVPCFVKKENILKIAKEQKLGTEEVGRKIRYDFFEEVMNKVGGNKIATAHNANDNAETVMMNFLRGSGTSGLKGIEPIRNNKFIRPIIECTRKEIEQYCDENNLNPKYDKTNQENIYTRNKIIGTVLCIFSVMPLFGAMGLDAGDIVSCAAVCFMLFVIAIACLLFVYAGTINDSMQKLLEEEEYTRENKARSGIYSAVSTCYWLLVTAVFLFVCFGPYGNAKPQYYWVIWAIAGVLYGAVTAVLKAVRRQ